MEFIQHTTNWVKGEIVEAIVMAIFGAIVVASGLCLWKFGTTLFGKALVVPLLVVGVIPLLMGLSGAISNKNSIPVYEKLWEENPEQFVQNEKSRVEGFDDIFKFTYPMAIILTAGGAILFFVLSSANWKAISLAMMTLGLMTYFIDHFAKERGDIYLEKINFEINK